MIKNLFLKSNVARDILVAESMAGSGLGCDDSFTFLCDESKDLCFDDLEAPTPTDLPYYRSPLGSDPGILRIPLRTDESFSLMLEREHQYFPKQDYLLRLRSGELDLNFRRDAFDWISKAHTHYCFRPLSFCFSMNYLDRFLSLHDLPKDRTWAVQLLAVACLSIAVKMEETNVPPLLELQVEDPKFVFEVRTIQRMELLVLTTLNWQMSAITPFSYVDYFLNKLTDGSPIPTALINKSFQLIICTTRGIDFLEFKPSEIAAAIAISVAGEIQQTVNIDKAISPSPALSSSSIHVQKDRVVKCVELIKDLSLMSECGDGGSSGFMLLPESPVGVLEARCFSNGSYDITVGGSSANTSPSPTPDTKRKKFDDTGHYAKS